MKNYNKFYNFINNNPDYLLDFFGITMDDKLFCPKCLSHITDVTLFRSVKENQPIKPGVVLFYCFHCRQLHTSLFYMKQYFELTLNIDPKFPLFKVLEILENYSIERLRNVTIPNLPENIIETLFTASVNKYDNVIKFRTNFKNKLTQ